MCVCVWVGVGVGVDVCVGLGFNNARDKLGDDGVSQDLIKSRKPALGGVALCFSRAFHWVWEEFLVHEF